MDAPCKGCTDRHEMCWGECERYLEYKSEHDLIKQRIAFEREQVSLEHQRARRNRLIAESVKKSKNKS